MRAGAFALSLLSVPLNVHILQALKEEPRPLIDLRSAVGSPPQTTMRGHLNSLTKLGILERQRRRAFPGAIDLEFGRPGRELIDISRVLQSWLTQAPDGPIELGSPAAKSSIKALVEGWSSAILRVLAAKPLALTELNRLITDLSYPSLERRLNAMRLAGQIEPCPGAGRGTPYLVTDWLRAAVGPLAAAARWERINKIEEGAPTSRIDVESAFLLSVPLVNLSPDFSGICRLAVDLRSGRDEHRIAGVLVEIREGKVISCVSRLGGNADAWALGSASAWFGALIEQHWQPLEIGGDCRLATALLEELHGALLRSPVRA